MPPQGGRMELILSSYIKEVLHVLSQGLLIPVLAILIILVIFLVYVIGSLIAEILVERRHFKAKLPVLFNQMMDASVEQIPDVIQNSGLLNGQKDVILTIFNNRQLPDDVRMALADRALKENEDYYQKRLAFTDLIARVAPMFGLMATLIPLGPGIVALGQGDTATLSESLTVAFDATVAGLLLSVISLGVSKLRKHWYGGYINALKNTAITMLRKIDDLEWEAEEAAEDAAEAAEAAAGAAAGAATRAGER
jgi:biopolymer transport protein ExbB/TolQ